VDQQETTRSLYFCDVALLNVHTLKGGPAIREADIRMSGLDAWADRYGAVKSVPGGVGMSHVAPLVALLGFGRLSFERHESMRLGFSSGEVRADSGISLRYDRPTDLMTVVRTAIEPTQDLVTFLLGVPCHLTQVKVYVSTESGPYLRERHEITVLMAGSRFGGTLQDRPTLDDPLLLTHMLDRFSAVVAKWFDLQRILKLPLSLLLAADYAPSGFIDSAFLQVVQACEAFHRRLFAGLKIPASDFQTRRDRILAAVDDADRPAVQRALALANEYSLQQRISELLKVVPQDVRKPWGRIGQFANRVANTRNALSHGLKPDQNRDELDADGMLLATARLRRALRVLIFLQLGFSHEDIQSLLRWGPMVY